MKLELQEFKERLRQEVAKGANPAQYIQHEIRKAENLKIGLVEEINHAKDFVPEATNKIDSYVILLHELAKDYPLEQYQLDQQVSLEDTQMQERLKQQLNKLDQENDSEAPGKVHPLDLS